MTFTNFNEAVTWVNSLKSVPDTGAGERKDKSERHYPSKTETHYLVSFERYIFKNPDLEVVIEWNICPDCGSKVRNYKIVVIAGNQVFRKYFIRHGENILLGALFNK